MKTRTKRGFTLIELLVVIAIIALLIGILLPALGRARKNAQQLKDGTQIRGVMQALLGWAQDNKGRFPDPQQLDRLNKTLADGVNKNRTGNVYSMLIWVQSVTPELMVGPAETAPIVPMQDYKYSKPTGTREPDYALWDPRFIGSAKDDPQSMGSDPPSGGGGSGAAYTANNSYAHACLSGARTANWGNNLSSTLAVVGNRGPAYKETKTPTAGQAWTLQDGGQGIGVDSNTLLIHGTENKWEGNIGYGDAHVNFETEPDPESVTFVDRTQGTDPINQRDNLFVDETNEGTTDNFATRRNALLRIWKQGIPTNVPFAKEYVDAPGSYVYVD